MGPIWSRNSCGGGPVVPLYIQLPELGHGQGVGAGEGDGGVLGGPGGDQQGADMEGGGGGGQGEQQQQLKHGNGGHIVVWVKNSQMD